MTRKAKLSALFHLQMHKNWWQKRCSGDEQHHFAVCYLRFRAHVAGVSGATIRVTDDMLVAMENPAGIASVGAASSKDWPGNIFEGVLRRCVGFKASLEIFSASDFFEVLVTAFPRSGIFTMVTFQAVHCVGKYSKGKIVYQYTRKSTRYARWETALNFVILIVIRISQLSESVPPVVLKTFLGHDVTRSSVFAAVLFPCY